MNKDIKISAAMTKPVVSVTEDQQITDVRDLMSSNGVHHVPVVRDKKVIGIISSNDLFALGVKDEDLDSVTLDAYFNSYQISEVMTPDVITITLENTIEDAVKIFLKHNFQSLPVINDQQDLVGVLTTRDILRILL